MAEKLKILVTVKTYPQPSRRYDEIVCTAGVREDGTFVRLYPIQYRHMSYWQWYKKYQWIELEVERHRGDPRPESFRPISTIRPCGKPISSQKGRWAERKRYVLAGGVGTMCELEKRPQSEVSLGIIKAHAVEDFLTKPTAREWKPEWVDRMRQMKLFGPDLKPVEKIPFKFSYKFKCTTAGCRGHTKMTEDWEAGELYRKMRDRYGDEKLACEKVKERFFGHMCAADRDTYFFVGTVLEHGSWIVLGTFWPKREPSPSRKGSRARYRHIP